MKPAVQHFEINATDFDRAKQFYQDVFDWEINDHDGNYALVSPGGEKSIGGGIGKAHSGQRASVTFYVTVDDINAYLAKVEKSGGKVILPLTPIEDVGYFALFADPDDNVIGLYKGRNA